ncbi:MULTISPECIES: carboxypeptidase-like regulatory domain-containing protein [Niastella]|uniref:Carboxypeptidase regulatory-like domain-containing protein n=1 Tax=Niastella soli TaxID=2821487 RepID=A0ABS3Z2A2_9BACT|nr:carboxypeptidase-like regulatory domain-containing protein [Niastella soli]MBO9203531.1 carboxypeptidase regulatory-like domain-containing protein [Niastella soli]
MKRILSLGFAAIIMALVIIISCKKSDNNPSDNSNNIEQVTAGISGRVLDNNNQPVNGAVVKAGTAAATTDINGNFSISNVSLNKRAGFVKVEKDGFFTGSRTIMVKAGATNYVSIQLIKKTVSGTVSGSNGGNINVQGGGSVVFTGNSFVNTSGNSAYTGTVSVSTYFLNPTSANFSEIMPGTLRGITTTNEETGLQSYGMMAVELTGANGEKLQLAAGKTATLTFPIPAGLQGAAPATIPLWSFNDTTGLWKEEGVATKQGTNYVGTVSHFTWWNCDFPYGVVDFSAVIKDQNGKPLFPARIELKTLVDTITRYSNEYTDATGLVSGVIPKGKSLELKIYNQCNTVVYSQSIGPFNAATDLGTITVNVSGTSQVTVSGTVTNCNDNAVTNGFVDISIESLHNRAAVTNGSFSMTITRCSGAPATAVITAYDLDANQIGSATNVAINSATVNAGKLSACGNSVTQFVTYTINGTDVSYISPADSLKAVTWLGNNYSEITAMHKPHNGNLINLRTRTAITATGSYTVYYAYINENPKQYINSSSLTLNVTEFGPANTGYISGNLSADLKDSTTKASVPTNVSFRIKRPTAGQ